jgi:hypothetical protein
VNTSVSVSAACTWPAAEANRAARIPAGNAASLRLVFMNYSFKAVDSAISLKQEKKREPVTRLPVVNQ